MLDRSWITVFILIPVIFRYHLPFSDSMPLSFLLWQLILEYLFWLEIKELSIKTRVGSDFGMYEYNDLLFRSIRYDHRRQKILP